MENRIVTDSRIGMDFKNRVSSRGAGGVGAVSGLLRGRGCSRRKVMEVERRPSLNGLLHNCRLH